MHDLAAIFADAGCRDVRTYIQSGNVVFRAIPAVACRVPTVVSQTIADRFGYHTPVVTRWARELRRVARNNPFLGVGAKTDTLHVVFLLARPTAAAVRSLDPHRSPPDEFRGQGREVYLRCPRGLARSKFTNQYFDSTLAATTTVRSWRTVIKLVELTDEQLRTCSHRSR